MRKFISLLTAGVLCAALLCACSSTSTKPATSSTASTSASTATTSASASAEIKTESSTDTSADTSADASTDTSSSADSSETTEIPNPLTSYATYDELAAAFPDLTLYQPADEATDVVYQDIDKTIAEIQFNYSGSAVNFRATACADADSLTDISGLNYDFTAPEAVGDTGLLQYTATEDGSVQMLVLYDPDAKTEYCVSTDGSMDAETFKAAFGTILLAK